MLAATTSHPLLNQDLVLTKFGVETWETLVHASKVPACYEDQAIYDDSLLVSLVTSICQVSGLLPSKCEYSFLCWGVEAGIGLNNENQLRSSHPDTVLQALGLEVQPVLELAGKWFVTYVRKTQYNKLFEVGADSLCDFLINLNTIHTHIRRWYFPQVTDNGLVVAHVQFVFLLCSLISMSSNTDVMPTFCKDLMVCCVVEVP